MCNKKRVHEIKLPNGMTIISLDFNGYDCKMVEILLKSLRRNFLEIKDEKNDDFIREQIETILSKNKLIFVDENNDITPMNEWEASK